LAEFTRREGRLRGEQARDGRNLRPRWGGVLPSNRGTRFRPDLWGLKITKARQHESLLAGVGKADKLPTRYCQPSPFEFSFCRDPFLGAWGSSRCRRNSEDLATLEEPLVWRDRTPETDQWPHVRTLSRAGPSLSLIASRSMSSTSSESMCQYLVSHAIAVRRVGGGGGCDLGSPPRRSPPQRGHAASAALAFLATTRNGRPALASLLRQAHEVE
jgi:hypothetical protein